MKFPIAINNKGRRRSGTLGRFNNAQLNPFIHLFVDYFSVCGGSMEWRERNFLGVWLQRNFDSLIQMSEVIVQTKCSLVFNDNILDFLSFTSRELRINVEHLN